MSKYISKKQALGGLIWVFLERCGNQGISFVISIILARLLEPSAYGVVALVSVFSAMISVFVGSGFNTALIQKKDAEDIDYSSVFYFNCFMGITLYFVIFMTAPNIAKFYHDNSLVPLIRVHSLHLIIGSLNSVQCVYAWKNYLFKKFFWATLGGTIMAAFLGISMAFHGYGPWALVAQGLLNQIVDVLILWFTVRWRPKVMFSFARLREMFRYGSKMLMSSLLDTWYSKLRTLCIGKIYTKNDLAFYHKGNVLPSMIVSNINGSMNSVLFPSMSAMQNDPFALKSYTRRAIKTSTFLMMPLMAILAATADSVIVLLLTEKWLSCVFYMRVFCFVYAFFPITSANLCAIQAMGRSDIYLRLEIIKKTVGLIMLLSTVWISVKALAISAIASSIASQIIDSYPNKKLLDYGYWNQLRDMFPQILLSIIAGAVAYSFFLVHWNPWLTLFAQGITGLSIYFLASWLFHLEAFAYLLEIVKNSFQSVRKKLA